MFLSGIADEAGHDIDTQVRAHRELGWNHIEIRAVSVDGAPARNLHDVSDDVFDLVERKVKDAGLTVNCFASTIGNPSKKLGTPLDDSVEIARRASGRMRRLGAPLVRIMSYVVRDGNLNEDPRFARLREIVAVFTDAGLTPVHENCANYGGLGWTYALRLLENVPGLKLLFDTGNPPRDDDWASPAPYPKQSAWAFYEKVRDHVRHVHLKDGVYDTALGRIRYTFPGDGEGDVVRILTDLRRRGYDGGVSIEPHVVGEWRDGTIHTHGVDPYSMYVEYGRRLARLVEQVGG